jgi:hypothetical protein
MEETKEPLELVAPQAEEMFKTQAVETETLALKAALLLAT